MFHPLLPALSPGARPRVGDPDIDPDSLGWLVARRESFGEDCDATGFVAALAVHAGQDILQGVMHDDDAQSLGDVTKKAQGRAKRARACALVEDEAASAAKPKAKTRAKKRAEIEGAAREPLGQEELPVEWAAASLRQYVPAGAQVAVENHWHHRVRVAYHGDLKPPYSFSANFGPRGQSIEAAAKTALRWVWDRHQGNGGEACPHAWLA